jgi:DNA helicase-2/ATP-dependent DNA helicase PcrA
MVAISDLNPEQRAAVLRVDGPTMILAGAGTGKTRVIVTRIAHMLKKGIPADQIVAVTFTNKAAREMADRVKAVAGAKAKDVWIGTFHSFCLRILRTYWREAGLVPGFTLAGTSDQLDLVQRALDEQSWSGTYHVDKLHAAISNAKNELLSPDDVRKGKAKRFLHDDLTVLAEVYQLYERQLRLNRVIDFDDCIYKAVRLLREHPEVRAALRAKFRYFMVDEYQDTNESQLAVLHALASDTHDVCVVGDDDQSIYSWRGAMFEVLERFEEMFPGTQLIKLEQNYRCSNVILDAANGVIKNNTQRKPKELWSESTETSPITLASCEDESAEASMIVGKVISLLGAGLRPKDIAVLYRANAQARPIELKLREASIPYKTYGGQSFFERKEVKDFLGYLRLVLNGEDRLSLFRVINTPTRGIGTKTLEKLEETATKSKKSPGGLILGDEHGIGGASGEAISGFAAMINELKAMPRDTAADYEALGHALVKKTGLENDIKLRTEDAGSRERKLANLRSLPAWLKTVTADLAEEEGTIDEMTLLDVVTLDNDRRGKEKDGDHVSLMTIHAAKGLEFTAVFVVGVEEEQLPHKNSLVDGKALAEERRLFYVALTRAKKRLFVSHCLARQSGQNKVDRVPSRFLKEMPAHTHIPDDEHAAAAHVAKTAEERREKATTRFAALRGAIGLNK